MEFKKSVLSFLLLFAYTIGFAHDFIPHYHVEDFHFGAASKELISDNDKSNSIEHGEHLDSGVYEYLVCIFSDANHSRYNAKNNIIQTGINFVIQGDICLTNQFYFVCPVETVALKNDVKVSSKPITDNSSCFFSRSNRRGPPLFS